MNKLKPKLQPKNKENKRREKIWGKEANELYPTKHKKKLPKIC